MRARIAGLGLWLPETVRTNDAWPESFLAQWRERRGDRMLVDLAFAADDERGRAIARKHLALEHEDPFLGCRERRVATPETSGAEAEAWAAAAALADAGLDPGSVDVILSSAAVPDRVTPSNGCRVAHEIGATRASAATLDAGCASLILQLDHAASLVESGRARTVLLTQSHLITRVFPLAHPASPSVGDAATAAVVVASETAGIEHTHAVTHGNYYDSVTWRRGYGEEDDPPWWEAGGPMRLGSHDPVGMRELIHETVPTGARTVSELADKAGFPVASIDLLVSVQPRGWIPPAIAETLGLDPDRAPRTYDWLAHLGQVGPVANLVHARREGLLRSGARVVIYAQGAGFTRGAVALRW